MSDDREAIVTLAAEHCHRSDDGDLDLRRDGGRWRFHRRTAPSI